MSSVGEARTSQQIRESTPANLSSLLHLGASYTNVPGGTAQALADNLNQIYKSSTTIRISAVGPNSIMVYATPNDQFEIAQHIQGSKEQISPPELIQSRIR